MSLKLPTRSEGSYGCTTQELLSRLPLCDTYGGKPKLHFRDRDKNTSNIPKLDLILRRQSDRESLLG